MPAYIFEDVYFQVFAGKIIIDQFSNTANSEATQPQALSSSTKI